MVESASTIGRVSVSIQLKTMNVTKTWMRAGLIAPALFFAASGLLLLCFPAVPLTWYGLAVVGIAIPLLRLAGVIDLGMAAGFASACISPCQSWAVALGGFVLHLGVMAAAYFSSRSGELPADVMPAVLIHDGIWCLPLGAILVRVFQEHMRKRCVGCSDIQTFAMRAKTQYGVSLLEMSNLSPVLVVFLRHIGCTFCREAIADLATHRREIESQGVQIALVHMGQEDQIEPFLALHGLAALPRIGDRTQSVYRAFGLRRGSIPQLFGPKVWIRGLSVGPKYGMGRTVGDAAQMPGAFLVFHGEVLKSYQHQSAADRADFVALVSQQDYPIAS